MLLTLRYLGILSFGCALLLSLPACSFTRTRPVGVPVDSATTQTVISQLGQRAKISSVRFRGSMTVDTGRERFSSEVVGALDSQGSARLELIPAGTGFATQLIVAKDDQATAVDSLERKVFKSDSAEHMLRRYFGLPLSPAELFKVMTAQFQITGIQGDAIALSRSKDGNLYFLNLEGVGRTWTIDARSLEPVVVELRNQFNSELLATLQYFDFKTVEGLRLPNRIDFTIEEIGSRSTIIFEWRKVNLEIADELFEAREPAGYEVVQLKVQRGS